MGKIVLKLTPSRSFVVPSLSTDVPEQSEFLTRLDNSRQQKGGERTQWSWLAAQFSLLLAFEYRIETHRYGRAGASQRAAGIDYRSVWGVRHHLPNLTILFSRLTNISTSIGGACARQLAAEGVNLALTYSTNREKLQELVLELKKSAPCDIHVSMHKVDLASPVEIEKLLREVKEQHPQPVEILVANAGYGKRIVNIEDIELDQFEQAFNVNLRAPFLLVKGVVDGMKANNWGRIIFVSSIAASGGGINGCRKFLAFSQTSQNHC